MIQKYYFFESILWNLSTHFLRTSHVEDHRALCLGIYFVHFKGNLENCTLVIPKLNAPP